MNWKSYSDFVEEFKLYFLPVQFFETLNDEIRNRLQRRNESFVDYVTSLQSLMRWSHLSSDEQLERIFRNCRSEYKMYIKRREFTKLRDLIIMAKEYESICIEETKSSPRIQTVVVNNKNSICYRCGQTGHQRAKCVRPQVLFCWDWDRLLQI